MDARKTNFVGLHPMIEKPRIFISHSSQDKAITEALCDKLRAAGNDGEAGYDVLVDYTALEKGTDWPKQLHEWMARCHAAVILLTEDAVKSPWVLKEASILSWRKAIDGKFRLFLVKFPNVTPKLFKEHKFDPLMLDRLQRINSIDPDGIARTVRETIDQPTPGETPFDTLVGRLSDLFERVGKNTLKGVAERICVDPPQWRPDRDARQQYIEMIACRFIRENLGGYRGVDQLVDDLSATTSPMIVKQILKILSPWWVESEAAGRLASLAELEERRAAAMNGAKVPQFTAKMYVRRAHPLSSRYRVISTAGGNSGDVVAHVTSEICENIRRYDNVDDSDEEIIAELGERSPELYVVLPPPPPPDVPMKTLLQRFPKLTFILWTGETLESETNPDDVDCLMPELDLSLEERQEKHFRAAERIIRNMTEE